MRRSHRLVLVLTAALFVGPWPPAGAQGPVQPVLATGRIIDPTGRPVSGPIEVRAWPTAMPLAVGDVVHTPLVTRGSADRDGQFTLRAGTSDELVRFAEANNGYVNFVMSTPDGGEWHFSRYLGPPATFGAAGDVGAIHWSERPDEPAQPLEVSAGALPAMAGSRGGAHFGMCGPEKIIKTDRAPTKIGEINAEGDTAYNMFTYGEGNTADSDISVAIKGKGPWQLSGSHHIGNSKQAEVRHEGGPGQSLWFTSGFDYHLVEDRCRQKVIVHQWRSGIEPHRQMNQGCTIDPYRHHAESYGPGSTFYRSESRAVTWTGAAEVYGASLTSRSGFSKHVHMALKFGQGSSHWLCGDNDVPPKSSRVFSGNSSPI